MNTDTGHLYHTFDQITAAQKRGEPLEIIEDPTPEQIADMEQRSAELIKKTRNSINVTWRKKFKV